MYHPVVIRRLYVHNFRCLENFELKLAGQSSVLLIGKNGSGKTTVGLALEILQKVARGTNRVADLVKPKDLSRGRVDVPMRFEIEVELDTKTYQYSIAFELGGEPKQLAALEERLWVDGKLLYFRSQQDAQERETNPLINRELVGLPVIYLPPSFMKWLARMLILRPIPNLISGDYRCATADSDFTLIWCPSICPVTVTSI